jgi:spore coat protein CotF
LLSTRAMLLIIKKHSLVYATLPTKKKNVFVRNKQQQETTETIESAKQINSYYTQGATRYGARQPAATSSENEAF